ncbi:MAG: cytochrome P450 [Chloroflexi bacterium]|nr:cytochrome P450 [Chloroflexota bacterium]
MLEAQELTANQSLPTPPAVSGGLPGLGHVIEFGRGQEALFRRGYAEHGSVFRIQLLGQPAAVLVGPDEHNFFFKHTDKELDMEEPYGFLAAIFGKIAFLGTHETYMLHRPVLHSLFGRQQMVDYFEVMSRVVAYWMDNLGDEGEMDITFELTEVVKEVAGRCVLGEEVHERLLAEGFWKHYDTLSASLDPIFYKLPLPRFIRRDRSKRRIREILQPLITERRRSPKADGFQHLLDQTDAAGNPLPDDIIASFFSALMFAGHETTAGQTAWSVLQLIEEKDAQARVRAEIDEVLADTRVVDHVALRNLSYINAAVQESGRLHPSAETLLRAVKEEVQINGYRIPKGWFVMTSTAAAHFVPEVYKDPFTYAPERFAERGEGKGSSYLSFGGGMHKCTGMNFASAEMAIIVALLFRDFDLDLVTPFSEIGVDRVGSSRPTSAIVRYSRKSN